MENECVLLEAEGIILTLRKNTVGAFLLKYTLCNGGLYASVIDIELLQDFRNKTISLEELITQRGRFKYAFTMDTFLKRNYNLNPDIWEDFNWKCLNNFLLTCEANKYNL